MTMTKEQRESLRKQTQKHLLYMILIFVVLLHVGLLWTASLAQQEHQAIDAKLDRILLYQLWQTGEEDPDFSFDDLKGLKDE